nr:probable cinnamyl alcohol dehydrogenase 1 [Ipomoea batatas]
MLTCRVVGSDDVSLDIAYCGICYADVIWTRNEGGTSKYPLVPGHEIVGIVKEVGSNVIQRFKVGDPVGVGAYVNSCRECKNCNENLEVECSKGAVPTFDGIDADGTLTKGGYSTYIVVHQSSPSKHLSVGDLAQILLALSKSFDFLINTASGDIPFDLYLSLLKTGGVLALVGFPKQVKFSPGSLSFGMKSIAGSITGGTKLTQEMLEFCASHKIYPEIEIVPIQYVNEALERLINKDIKYRFVIDIGSSLKTDG